MEQECSSVRAWLSQGDRRTAVEANPGSKYSLWVRFTDGESFADGAEFSRLVLELDGESHDIGPCRLLSEPNIDGYAGRIVPIGDFYNFEGFFFRRKTEKLTQDFLNLPLLIGHRGDIHQEFKNYVSDLTYDLSVYKNLFDKLEQEYRNEPPKVRALVERFVIRTKGREFLGYLDTRLEELDRIVAGFNKTEHERHGFYFRRQLWSHILSSPVMSRTNLKPRGYAGDSEMMRMIYRNEYEGDSLMSKLLHKHPVEQPGAQAVRNRRGLVTGMIKAEAAGSKGRSRRKIRVLSVACGPAFELTDFLDSRANCRRFEITLFDQDQYALMEASKVLGGIEKKYDTRVQVNYLRESVRTMLFSPQLKEQWGQFQFIYSMGLFDYFTPPVARATLAKLFQLLVPGGQMVIGNFHTSNPSRIYMEYWLDWAIYYRTEADFMDLARDLAPARKSITYDETGVQMLLRIKKGGGP